MKDESVFQVVESDSDISLNQNKKCSKVRNVASQIIATIACNLVKFSHGNLTALTVLLIGELSQENAEIKVTKDQLSWFGSYFFMSPVGAILFGLLSHKIGSRAMLLITSVTYCMAGMMFHFATNSTMILVPQAFVGLMIPATISSGTTYITEIAQPHLRSPLTTSGYLCMSFGTLFTMLMSQFFKTKTIAIIITVFPVIGFVGILFVPNSPFWLARKGRFNEAEVSLAWLRGWTTLSNVRSEFLTLKEANTHEENEDIQNQKRPLRVIIKPYMEKSLWIPMSIVFCVLAMFKLTGGESMRTYNLLIFEKYETPFDIKVASTIYDGVSIFGAIICMFSINTFGKRKLLFTSLIGGGSAYLVIALVLLLIKLEIGNSSGYLYWVPPVMLIFSSFIFSLGIDKVSYMLNSELLPTRFREIGMGMGRFISTLLLAMLRKVLLYMMDAMTLQGVFLFFGTICFIALVTFYFIVPETEGKSLIEIENHFAGNQSETVKTRKL
ncbi:facilitated trehalose transporter Tret1-2 homolog isoform X2 [Nasonia vitripennis]|uniref:Major facilitator superfamily (MFS) profile domain-containing protein n=1 Tax=Nasonia vitripennis TaxID=7425 RepID=A0A7M7GAW5_NASVI|nr:facilitated trehalose transporter Tret1-2 homolog isoform X2 [Nasonia vitripennis]